MASNKAYITAGLSVPKASGQSPTSQVNTFYVTAGLPKIVEAAGGGGVGGSPFVGPFTGPLSGPLHRSA